MAQLGRMVQEFLNMSLVLMAITSLLLQLNIPGMSCPREEPLHLPLMASGPGSDMPMVPVPGGCVPCI